MASHSALSLSYSAVRPTTNALGSLPALHGRQIPPGALSFGAYAVCFARAESDEARVEALFEAPLREVEREETDAELADTRPLHHGLMVLDQRSHALVAAARLTTAELLAACDEPRSCAASVIEQCVEVPSVCIARRHLSPQVASLLLAGAARYADWNDKRYVRSACSLLAIPGGALWLDLRARALAELSMLAAPGNWGALGGELA